MKELDDKMFGDILANSGSQYFFHKEDTGEVTMVLKSGIVKVEPGEEDSAGRVWSPKLTDANGNPLLDWNGNPKEPWAKFEAEVTIDGAPNIYSFSGEKSSVLRNFIMAMKKEGISNSELPGTIWSIDRIGKWDWNIKYLGREEENSSSSSSSKETNEENLDIKKIKEALQVKKDQSSEGIPENDLIGYISFILHKKSDEVKDMMPELIDKGLLKKENNLIYIQ